MLEERKQVLKLAVDEAQAGKQKVLVGQREGLEHAVASMASGVEHARRTAKLCDDYEIMHAYSQIVSGMRGLQDREYELDPNTSASIQFVDTSQGGLAQSLSQHARIVARNVWPSRCTAEGRGLTRCYAGGWSSFTVRAVDRTGEACIDVGDLVEMRLMGMAAEGGLVKEDELEDELELATDVRVVDGGDGTYKCTYSVSKDTRPQMARLEVRVNGGQVFDSPFSISINDRVLKDPLIFSYTRELEVFKVPSDGNYRITTKGAKPADGDGFRLHIENIIPVILNLKCHHRHELCRSFLTGNGAVSDSDERDDSINQISL